MRPRTESGDSCRARRGGGGGSGEMRLTHGTCQAGEAARRRWIYFVLAVRTATRLDDALFRTAPWFEFNLSHPSSSCDRMLIRRWSGCIPGAGGAVTARSLLRHRDGGAPPACLLLPQTHLGRNHRRCQARPSRGWVTPPVRRLCVDGALPPPVEGRHSLRPEKAVSRSSAFHRSPPPIHCVKPGR